MVRVLETLKLFGVLKEFAEILGEAIFFLSLTFLFVLQSYGTYPMEMLIKLVSSSCPQKSLSEI